MEYIHTISSPLGNILLSGKKEVLTGLWFQGQKHFASTLTEPCEERYLPVFEETEKWLEIYFSGGKPDLNALVTSVSADDFVACLPCLPGPWEEPCPEIPYPSSSPATGSRAQGALLPAMPEVWTERKSSCLWKRRVLSLLFLLICKGILYQQSFCHKGFIRILSVQKLSGRSELPCDVSMVFLLFSLDEGLEIIAVPMGFGVAP